VLWLELRSEADDKLMTPSHMAELIPYGFKTERRRCGTLLPFANSKHSELYGLLVDVIALKPPWPSVLGTERTPLLPCNGVRRLHIRVRLFGVGYITSVVHLGYIVTLSNDSSILGLGGYIPGYGLPGILVMGGFPYREISQSIQQFVFDQEQRSSIGIDLEHQVQASSSKGACNGRGPLHARWIGTGGARSRRVNAIGVPRVACVNLPISRRHSLFRPRGSEIIPLPHRRWVPRARAKICH
jgi:hypothetical protein